VQQDRLESVFLIHRLPAWGTTLRSRVNRLPKAHAVDSGVGAWLLGVTAAGLARRRPATVTEFGHLLETFAVNELLKQAAWMSEPIQAGHFRTSDGHEVDLILELPDGSCAGFEIKAGATLRPGDERGLARLRDHLQDRFLCGPLLYLGERNARLSDRIYALPLDRLWT
jgi:hypothetical protein